MKSFNLIFFSIEFGTWATNAVYTQFRDAAEGFSNEVYGKSIVRINLSRIYESSFQLLFIVKENKKK